MKFLSDYQSPSSEYRIKPFWFWNGEITKEEVAFQLKEMAEKGMGGVFICARQGMTIPYLSKAWFDMVSYACQEAKKLGLEAWLYDEYPYPSGMSGGEVLLKCPEAEHKILKHFKFDLTGNGEMIQRELGWGKILCAYAYPVLSNGAVDWQAGLDIGPHIGILQPTKLYQQTGLTRYNNKRFFSYDPTNVLEISLPEGNWRIEICSEEVMGEFKYYKGYFDPCSKKAVETFLQTTHQRYERFLDNDVFSYISGVFSDEVGFLSPVPWSGLLPEYFEKRNGYDICEKLPAVYDETYPQAGRIRYDLLQTIHELFTDSYHRQISEWCQEHGMLYATEVPSLRMTTQRFSDIVGGDTAHEKLGKSLEWIYDEYIKKYRSNAKAVSSLARQLGKKYAMIESFHSVGWTMTLQDAKWMIDRLGASGINFYNFHAFYYTIQDITKHDAPPSQFLQNPYWNHYKILADYVARMSVMLTNTSADIHIAVVDPVAAMWAMMANPIRSFDYVGESENERQRCEMIRENWVNTCKTLLFGQLDYDHLDAEILSEAEVLGGRLLMGAASYSVVVLPMCHCLERAARLKLAEFVKQGGCLIYVDSHEQAEPFISIDREESDSEAKEAWNLLLQKAHKANLAGDLECGDSSNLISVCKKHMDTAASVNVISGNSKDVISCVRTDDAGSIYVFISNQGRERVEMEVHFNERRGTMGDRVPSSVDPDEICNMASVNTRLILENGESQRISECQKDVRILLDGFESIWVMHELQEVNDVQSNDVQSNDVRNNDKQNNDVWQRSISTIESGIPKGNSTKLKIPTDGLWKIKPSGKNICRFGSAKMSLDGKTWEKVEAKTFIEQCADQKLLSGKEFVYDSAFGTPRKIQPGYPIDCSYQIGFYAFGNLNSGHDPVDCESAADALGRVNLLMDKESISGEYTICVNGSKAAAWDDTDNSSGWQPVWVNDYGNQAVNISGSLVNGYNEIRIDVKISKDEDGLRDPIYLMGDFGVRSQEETHADNFGQFDTCKAVYLNDIPEYARINTPYCEGYPYYSGCMEYTKLFDLEELSFDPALLERFKEAEISFQNERSQYDCVELILNGHSLGVAAWTPYVWNVKKEMLLNHGNKVNVRVTNTLANMLDGTFFDYGSHQLVKIE